MPIFGDNDLVRRNRSNLAALGREKNSVRIARYFLLQSGAYERRLGNNERHTLTLHVGTHQRPVRVVVFEERNEARCHRHKLLRRHVHVMHFRRIDFEKVATVAHRNFFPGEVSAPVNWSIRLRNEKIFFAITCEIVNLIRHAAVFHFAIWRFDKTEFVDAREGAHRTDQANVWTFRRLDRTNAAVMRWMNVAHLESRTLTAETSRPESRQTAFVRQLRERIRLVHKL